MHLTCGGDKTRFRVCQAAGRRAKLQVRHAKLQEPCQVACQACQVAERRAKLQVQACQAAERRAKLQVRHAKLQKGVPSCRSGMPSCRKACQVAGQACQAAGTVPSCMSCMPSCRKACKAAGRYTSTLICIRSWISADHRRELGQASWPATQLWRSWLHEL